MNSVKERYRKVRAYIKNNNIGGIYISSPENYLYFSGYNNPDGFMIITENKSYVFADFRYIEAVKNTAYEECEVLLQGESATSEIIKNNKIESLGYEDQSLTKFEFSRLTAQLGELGCRLVPVGNEIVEERSVKYNNETECIIKAQRIAESAFEHLLSVINYDMTEIDVVAELEYFMKKSGSEKTAFDTIAVSGTLSSVPHGVPRNETLNKGFLTLDYGARVGGYCSDMTRTIIIGKADDDMKRLYNTVYEAQKRAIDYLVDGGRECVKADALAREYIDTNGYAGCFKHGLGHGVGLLIHELPNLNTRAEGRQLVPGNIVTVEPGIYIEGKYGCRIEDMVCITEDGGIDITECTKELIEI